jgi:amino acid adenylation domain-containing protein
MLGLRGDADERQLVRGRYGRAMLPATSPTWEMTQPDIAAASEFENLEWLEDGRRALDSNGPSRRIFIRFRDEDLDRSIIHHLERVVRRQPARMAVADTDTSLTYAALWDGLSGLAEGIAARTRPGDLVGILLPASPMFPVAMLACMAAGRPFVALDPHYPGDWLAQVLGDARPAVIIRGEDAQGIEPGSPTADVVVLAHLPLPAREGWRPAEPGLDEPACVLFTSGSTGRPKGIVNSQRNLLQRVAQSINAAHINAEDRFLTLASLSTIVGVRDVMTALLSGAGIRLVDPQRVGAREIVEVVRTEGITILFAFPALLRSVLASGAERAGDALRLIRVGGDTTLWSDIDLMRAWAAPGAAIQLIYAATEAPMMQWFVDDAFRGEDARIPIGFPLPGNRLAVIDEFGHSTPPGEIGELVVASPYVTVGSWVDGRFCADAIELCADRSRRIFRTGDLVRQRPDGLLERIGRKDRQVKIRGARVELEGVEAALRQHPAVRDVGVLTRAGGADGAVTLVAYVSTRDGAPAGLLEELKQLMLSAPASMRPQRFHLVEKIPRLPSSKLDVRALAALDKGYAAAGDAGAAVASSSAAANGDAVDGDVIARTVAQVWRRVLQAPLGGPDEDFFEAGGDSLKAITFMIELERALGAELSVGLINEAPRFGQLCATLRDRSTPRYVPLVLLNSGEGLPPVFFIHGVGGNVVEILPTARRMTYPGAVFGIQARGLAGEGPPHASVEAMAADYLREIRARQTAGPYYLCGYSFGGLVAFEMARLLREAGDEVGLVGLFDTMMSPVRWPLRAWLAIASRRIARMSARIGAGVRGRPASPRAQRRTPDDLLKSAPASSLKVAASALLASARYRPGFYDGELTLFSPSGREPGLPSLQSIWRRHASALVVVETAGDHATMLSAANAETTAASLTSRLPAAMQASG